MAQARSSDDNSHEPSTLPTSTYLITLPLPSIHAQTHLVAHLTHFHHRSLMVWCGEANPSTATSNAFDGPASSAVTSTSYPLLVEENKIEEQQSTAGGPPTGLLGREWAVAMTAPNSSSSISTSLFRTNLDIAKPMAARLSKRFQVSQLFLSLSLPEQLLELLEGPVVDPLGSKAVLLLEGSLGRVIKQSLETSNGPA